MQVQVHFNFHDEAEFIAFAQKFSSSLPIIPTVKTKDTEAKAEVKAPKPPSFEDKQRIKAEKAAMAEKPSDEEKSSEEITYQDVGKAINSVSSKKSRDAALGVLEKFGLKKVTPDVDPSLYGKIIEECDSVLAA